jgi:ABC-2 type transport system permease protein
MNIAKYLSIFKISFQQEFTYRINFIMWRVRNVLQVFLIFFLWSSVFADPTRVVFGYDRARILTYVFGILLLRAIVFASRTIDITGEIGSGDLTNYLLKPVSYFRYWFTRDLSSKALNLSFAVVETTILFLILKPPFFFQNDSLVLLFFLAFLVMAVVIYFCLLFLIGMITFWSPSSGWPAQFLFMGIVTEFLSGAIFPLDIFPGTMQKIIHFLPFQYLLFFPLQVYLGKVNYETMLSGFFIALFWLIILIFAVNLVWKRGLKNYAAEGR